MIPKATGIGKDGKRVTVFFERELTDDEFKELGAVIKDIHIQPHPRESMPEPQPTKSWPWPWSWMKNG